MSASTLSSVMLIGDGVWAITTATNKDTIKYTNRVPVTTTANIALYLHTILYLVKMIH